MSAYSTLRITRRTARDLIMGDIAFATDDTLKSYVDLILEDRLYNCQIVDDTEENDDSVIITR